jgi:uncharacterized protein YaiI (UPF0178 family)
LRSDAVSFVLVSSERNPVPDIFVDADGCPVKEEVFRVATRFGLRVTLVANQWMRTPDGVEFVRVGDAPDAADDWIAENVQSLDIVITGDIPLAARCVERGARVLGLKGRPLTSTNIGEAVATRDLLSSLRDSGLQTGGPAPFDKRDRSRFLQELDKMIHAILRESA